MRECFRALYAANAGFVIFCRSGISSVACKIHFGNYFFIENVRRFIGNFIAFLVFAFMPVIVFVRCPFGGKLMSMCEGDRQYDGAYYARTQHARKDDCQHFV